MFQKVFTSASCQRIDMPLSADILKRYPNPWFVETGTLDGDGVRCALAAGFPHIISIEIVPELAAKNRETFRGIPAVKIIAGDSAEVLVEAIRDITEPITFWLDAHWSVGDKPLTNDKTPILAELRQILTHPLNTHTILIDDARLFGTEAFNYMPVASVRELLLAINANYEFSFIDGAGEGLVNDILVAEPGKTKFQPTFDIRDP